MSRRGSPIVLVACGAALFAACGGSAAAAGPFSVGRGEAAFWAGPAADDATCGDRCWEYGLNVADGGHRLRLGVDHATVGDVWSVTVTDPGGGAGPSFSPQAGLYSQEYVIEQPRGGRWTVQVRADPEVGDLRFRMRAKLEDPLPVPVEPMLLAPNLQALPPYEFTFEFPVTNGSTDGAPIGAPVPAGRTSCHPEEVAEEGARRCLRMAFGVRNTGEGPMQLHFEDPGGFQDAVLVQRVVRSDGTSIDREAGVAKFHKTHQHYHHDKAIALSLWRVQDAATGKLEPAAPEHLKGFAHRNELLREWTVFYPLHDDFGFGLRAGWGDYYEWDRPGNYIDFGLNGDGRYVLRIVADPVGGILESNDADNASYSLIDVAGEQVQWLESGRGTDPWDRCKILMPMGAEPDLPATAQPLRPADCPPDTTGLPGAPAVTVTPPAVGAPPPAARKPAKRRRARRCVARRSAMRTARGRARERARVRRCRRAAAKRRAAARRRATVKRRG